jgi:tight adherence protein C
MEHRMDELTGKGRPDSDPSIDLMDAMTSRAAKLGSVIAPVDDAERTRLQARLYAAGFYHRQALVIFLGFKMMLIIGPALVGLALGLFRVVDFHTALLGAAGLAILGIIGPSFWLDMRKTARQTAIRRSLPDALDVLVICLEGGLSLPGAFKRVAGELKTAHPILAEELNISQQEIALGLSTGEAMRKFGERSDLEEVRSLAGVITQAERFGASLVKALRVHAETLRTKRLQYAEEMAQKATIKILFPTLLCIFPGIFVVILGPAAYQIIAMFKEVNK